MTLRPAEEVVRDVRAAEQVFKPMKIWPPKNAPWNDKGVEIIRAERIATARRVLEGLENDLNQCLTGVGGAPLTAVLRPGWKAATDAVRAYRVNPTALEALLKETKR